MRLAPVVGAFSVLAALAGAGAGWASLRIRERALERAAAEAAAAALPPSLPPFRLTERSGAPCGLDELRGKVWVAGFLFTRCPTVCPRLAGKLNELQTRLARKPGTDEVRLVAISVDPEHDTPAVLREWAAAFQADPQRWLFLTGERAAIWRLAEEGFKLPVAPDPGPDHPILHSQRLSLVDRQARVRGWFDPLGGPPGELDRLEAAITALLAEPR